MDSVAVNEKAAALIEQLAEGCTQAAGFTSFSPTVYDTAWVSMVAKSVHGERRWLFPECFTFLLDRQLEEGSWESYASEVDGILNTMAALLALKVHAEAPHWLDCPSSDDLDTRVAKASAALQRMLDRWDVEACIHVGFEILVPSLLILLQERGLFFTIPGNKGLMALNQKKLAKFDPVLLYQKRCITLIHSLEAFINKIDFNQVRHHKVGGSMMGSPASTAAYLMHVSHWDDEAERYLAMVVRGKGKERGGVPSAYPATTFMLSWATSTLLHETFTMNELGSVNMRTITGFLERELGNGSGLVGFAPGILEDADDTAKTILSLNLLGRPTIPDPMIKAFEIKDHFKTFQMERNPSFSANCNILNALLSISDPSKYAAPILKAASFLCDLWYNGDAKDKWNLSPQYSRMLLTHALVRLLLLWDTGILGNVLEDLIRDRIPIVLTQILIRTLHSMGTTHSPEAVSYGVLTLTHLSTLPWLSSLKTKISTAIQNGKKLVHDALNTSTESEYLWIEKVTYSSSILSSTYCLAALKTEATLHQWGTALRELANVPTEKLTKFTHFFSQMPLFRKEPQWLLQASLIEGYLFYPQLKHMSLDIFPRKDMAKDDYLEYVPLTWTTTNNKRDNPIKANFLWDMMVISMLNYQVDEYMEAVVGEKLSDELDAVKQLVDDLCQTVPISINGNMAPPKLNGDKSIETKKRPCSEDSSGELEKPTKRHRPEANGTSLNETAAASKTRASRTVPSSLVEVSQTLSRFIRHVLTHPHIDHATHRDRTGLLGELRTYLLAHITQIEDNARFSSQVPKPNALKYNSVFEKPGRSYFNWVHGTSAIHTSCPYSFAFVVCLTGSALGRGDCFVGAQQKYLAQAMVRHLAALCRQYNDYGSIVRDRAEQNVNSVNFPEFHEGAVGSEEGAVEAKIKEALYDIAEYERDCLNLTTRKLEGLVTKRVGDVLGLFVDVTDLHGQIYVVRDIASRMR